MSDHLPCLALLKQTKISDKTPLMFTSRKLNERKISQIKHRLCNTDWTDLLKDLPCNKSFNVFHSKLEEVMDDVAPKKTVCISGKRRYMEPWTMTGLEKSSRKCLKLYKESLLTTSGAAAKNHYKEYRNMLNKAKYTTQKTYYSTKSVQYKHNTKKLWQLLNQTVNKCKSTGNIIPYITINGLRNYDPKKIANSLESFI